MAKVTSKSTPLTKEELEALRECEITGVKTQEEGKVEILKLFKKEEIEGFDDDSFAELLDLLPNVITKDKKEEKGKEEELEEEEEMPTPKKKAAVAAPKATDKKKVVEKGKKASAPAKETDEELDELSEEVKKDAKKVAPKKVNAVVEEDETEEEEVEETPKKPIEKAIKSVDAPVKKVTTASAIEKFDGRNDEKHAEMASIFYDIFPAKAVKKGGDEFEYTFLKQGITIRLKAEANKHTVLNFDTLKIVDGELVGDLYLNRFKSVEELEPYLTKELLTDIEDETKKIGMFRGECHPSIKNMKESEVLKFLKNNKSKIVVDSINKAKDIDKKMKGNRERLEASLAE